MTAIFTALPKAAASVTRLHQTPDTALAGELPVDLFGHAVASGFDQNNDGKDDLLVGAPEATYNSQSLAGKAYLYRGSSTGVNPTPVWIDGGGQTDEHFGTSLAGGNMKPDNYANVIVGSPYYNWTNRSHCGRVLLYTNQTAYLYLPVRDDFAVGLYGAAQLGKSVAYAPKLVYGRKDIIGGAPGRAPSPPSIGVVLLKWRD